MARLHVLLILLSALATHVAWAADRPGLGDCYGSEVAKRLPFAPSLVEWFRKNESMLASLIQQAGERAFQYPSFCLHKSVCNTASGILEEILLRLEPRLKVSLKVTTEAVGTGGRLHGILHVEDPVTREHIIVDPTIRQFFVDLIPPDQKHRPAGALGAMGIPEVFAGTPEQLQALFLRHYPEHPEGVAKWVEHYLLAVPMRQIEASHGASLGNTPAERQTVRRVLENLYDRDWLRSRGFR
jgi:hypothetical protein